MNALGVDLERQLPNLARLTNELWGSVGSSQATYKAHKLSHEAYRKPELKMKRPVFS